MRWQAATSTTILLALLAWPLEPVAETPSRTESASPTPEAAEDPGHLLKQARGMLDDHPDACAKAKRGRKKRGKRRARRGCVERPVVAVANPQTDAIELVRAGKDISVGKGVVIQQGAANGVNTEYAPVYPAGATVLAVKRRVPVKKRGWKEVIYTPYSPALNTPAMRERGLEYLRTTVERARTKLRQRRVRSEAFKGRLVADVVPLELAMVLAINEHVDPNRYARGERARDLVDEVLVVLGANERLAYDYAVSVDGARGLYQFMPGTYDSIRKRYGRARLWKDFVRGTDDHVNAAMACLLLFDADLAVLPTAERRRLREDPVEMGRFLAATYNGGAGLVQQAYDGFNPLWVEALKAEETRTYVEKYEAIRRLLSDQMLHSAVPAPGVAEEG